MKLLTTGVDFSRKSTVGNVFSTQEAYMTIKHFRDGVAVQDFKDIRCSVGKILCGV